MHTRDAHPQKQKLSSLPSGNVAAPPDQGKLDRGALVPVIASTHYEGRRSGTRRWAVGYSSTHRIAVAYDGTDAPSALVARVALPIESAPKF